MDFDTAYALMLEVAMTPDLNACVFQGMNCTNLDTNKIPLVNDDLRDLRTPKFMRYMSNYT